MTQLSPTVLLLGGIAGVFLSLGLALTVIGVATRERRAVGRSLAALEALTTAPDVMVEELERPFSERVVEPLVARFTKLGRRLTPSDSARVQYRLDLAGNPVGWSVERIMALKVICFVAALVLSLVVTMLLGLSLVVTVVVCVGVGMLGYSAPNAVLYHKGSERSEKMQRDLPDALDLLTISVEAGLAFDAALSRVAKSTTGPLAEEFARVLQEMNIGMGRTDAMRALGERTAIPELKSFVTAMVQADAFGIPIGQVLRVQSTEMRTKRRQRAEEKAQKVPVKILFPLIFCILPTLFVAVMGPGVITMMEAFKGNL